MARLLDGQGRCISSGLFGFRPAFHVQKCGYVEGRFKLPMERGSWPGFWLLADDSPVRTPPGDPKTTGTGVALPRRISRRARGRRRSTSWKRWESGSRNLTPAIAPKTEKIKGEPVDAQHRTSLGDDFHTWGMEWDENNMVWTLDGKIIAHGKVTPSFQRPFYLLINLAAGGSGMGQ